MWTSLLDVLLDMDPGHDDALALLTALPLMRVLAVTAVAGNQTLDKTWLNARRILWAAGSHIPVIPGHAKPLLRDLVTAAYVHGESGLDGYAFPTLPPPGETPHATEYLARVFAEWPRPIAWVATGPLTNVAAFLMDHPHLAHQIASLTLMGGSLSAGNITAQAEFNIFVDPEAADYVMSSGLPIRMVGLDVTHKALLRRDDLDRFLTLRRPLGEMLFRLFSFYGRHEPDAGEKGIPIHDVLAVAALLHPELFTWKTTAIRVGRGEDRDRGQTIPVMEGHPVDVAVDIKVSAFFDWMWNALGAYR